MEGKLPQDIKLSGEGEFDEDGIGDPVRLDKEALLESRWSTC